jgi:hypothetical protein
MPREAKAPTAKHRYRWRTGDSLQKYGTSAKTWNAYSSTDEFKAAFTAIIDDESITNDIRLDRVEEFLIDQATTAGVVDKLPTHR